MIPERILITGGAGFVGSSLALSLKRAGVGEVIALDNLYRKGSELNRDRIVAEGVTFVRGDVRERSAFDIPPCDLIVDAAAEPSVLAGRGEDVPYLLDTNLGGTLNVLEAARRWNAALLFISTSRVFPVEALRAIPLRATEDRFEVVAEAGALNADLRSPTSDLRSPISGCSPAGISEVFPLEGWRTLYGSTKLASEIMAREYAAQFGLRVMVDRCGVLCGPWQMGKVDQGIVALWIARHVYGKPLSYFGYEGRQVRDVLHVEDFADLVLRQVQVMNAWRGDVFHVGGGREISLSLREMTALARTATGVRMDVGTDPVVRPGDVPWLIMDSARVRARFGWQPTRKVETIVDDTARWLKDHRAALEPILK